MKDRERGYAAMASVVLAVACGVVARPDCPATPASADARTEAPSLGGARATSGSRCEAGRTTLDVESCVGQEFGELEADLDKSLRDLEQTLRSRGTPEAASALISSQLDWEKFRDSHCALPEVIAGGGSLSGVDSANCRRDVTAQRLGQVRALLQGIMQ